MKDKKRPKDRQATLNDKNNGTTKKTVNLIRIYALASTLGFQVAAPIVIGILGGQYLDRKLGTGPWLMIICLFLGLAASITGLLRLVENIFGEEKKE
ncbi:MAG: AtpZ/AtpI family protein [Eubacteriales bacterium]|jgi:F0F1-type ATP synthase assembly protein I